MKMTVDLEFFTFSVAITKTYMTTMCPGQVSELSSYHIRQSNYVEQLIS